MYFHIGIHSILHHGICLCTYTLQYLVRGSHDCMSATKRESAGPMQQVLSAKDY